MAEQLIGCPSVFGLPCFKMGDSSMIVLWVASFSGTDAYGFTFVPRVSFDRL